MSRTLDVIFSDGEGWEHVSVSTPGRCPNWPEMCQVKDLFWAPEDPVMQLHPPQSDYINNHPYCLHLWHPKRMTIPLPDSFLVGVQQPSDGYEAEASLQAKARPSLGIPIPFPGELLDGQCPAISQDGRRCLLPEYHDASMNATAHQFATLSSTTAHLETVGALQAQVVALTAALDAANARADRHYADLMLLKRALSMVVTEDRICECGTSLVCPDIGCDRHKVSTPPVR
jgi:hypothetical protein